MSYAERSPHRTTVFKGAILTVAMRWTDRLMGIGSTMILARLLVPEDFGLVAMASIVAGLIDVLLDLGVYTALIQNTHADDADFHTAWTLKLGQASVAAVLVIVAAPFAADYFNDERVIPIMQVLALTSLIGGLENIGIVRFVKDMEFGRDFKFFFSKRVLGTVFTIGMALWLRSYWAMVLGALFTRSASVVISYLMHPFRPRFSLQRFGNLWSFSQWNLVYSLGAYLHARLDKLVVGGRTNPSTMGAYSLADEIATMPTTELLAPLGRVMLPAFVSAQSEPGELKRVYLLALGVQAMVGIPAGVGIALVASDAVPVLLGPKWYSAIPFAQVIGIACAVGIVGHSTHYAILAQGKIKVLAAYTWAQSVAFACLIALTLFSLHVDAAIGVAFARLLTAAVGLLAMIYLSRRFVPDVGVRDLLGATWRPATAASAMAAVVLAAGAMLESASVATLLTKVLVGACTYTLVDFLLWHAAARPTGAESYFLEKIGPLRRLRTGQVS